MSLPLHFLRPQALWLLLALPAFWFAWRSARSEAGGWRAAVDAHLLPHLLERIDGGPGRAGLWLAAALWTLACVALAGPAWEREPLPLYRNLAARVLALDLSPTMLAQDEKPTRLARARYKLDDILARSRDYQTALIGYAGDAFVAAPLTDDAGTVRNLVDSLDPSVMPVAGNLASRAIAAGVDLIEQAGLHRGEIVLLADDVDADAAGAARRARERGIEVSVLGIGSAAGAPVPLAQGDFLKDSRGNVVVARLDEGRLRAVADAGGGRYAHLAAGNGDLDALLGTQTQAVRGDAAQAEAGAEAQSMRWRDRGPWFVLLLLPLALFGFRRGWLMAIALGLSLPSAPVRAASFADLWQRSDQQAAAALARGDAKRAASVARSPAWRGGAAYRSGDYEGALRDYEQTQDADGAYNRGNALARLGRYEEAIAAYDEALKLAPGMDDASANRQAVEAFLKRQQQQGSSAGKQDQSGPHEKKPSQQRSQQEGQPQPKEDESGQGGQGDPSQQQESRKPSESDGKDGSQRQDTAGDAQPSSAGADRDERKDGTSEDAARKPDEQQQQALSQQIDKALAGQAAQDGGKDAAAQPPAAAVEDDAAREKQQALEHWLQRVPDDPGGLLRRKFQLEYQQRRQRGGDGS